MFPFVSDQEKTFNLKVKCVLLWLCCLHSFMHTHVLYNGCLEMCYVLCMCVMKHVG